GTGYYVWRVRPVGTYHDGGRSRRENIGAWNNISASHNNTNLTVHNFNWSNDFKVVLTSAPSNTVSTSGVNGDVFYYNQFDDQHNFIYGKVLTEGSRQSETITYANGLNQEKQKQTRIASHNTVIGMATAYDYSGRPAVKSLPAPVGDTRLGY